MSLYFAFFYETGKLAEKFAKHCKKILLGLFEQANVSFRPKCRYFAYQTGQQGTT